MIRNERIERAARAAIGALATYSRIHADELAVESPDEFLFDADSAGFAAWKALTEALALPEDKPDPMTETIRWRPATEVPHFDQKMEPYTPAWMWGLGEACYCEQNRADYSGTEVRWWDRWGNPVKRVGPWFPMSELKGPRGVES